MSSEGSRKVKHIAIILDGNRRWAKEKGLLPWKGHEQGMNKLKELIEWCKELEISELTLYCFSTENFNRPKEEIEFLMKAFREGFGKLKDHKDIAHIRVRAIGKIALFPKDMQKMIKEIMDKTKSNQGLTINFAMAYGGRQEIVDAVKKIAKDVEEGDISADEIDEKTITQNLYLSSEPDLIIRPGGEKRVSNFLIWQGNYSEWFFVDTLWPDFSKSDLKKILDEFSIRERRYGQ